jgi:hypothetical protein
MNDANSTSRRFELAKYFLVIGSILILFGTLLFLLEIYLLQIIAVAFAAGLMLLLISTGWFIQYKPPQ